jgi:dATP pyrophosphohydrolase
MRSPFQILVIPFRISSSNLPLFGALRRADDGKWQGIAGGGEGDETPIEAARRESQEEAGLPGEIVLYRLQAEATVPKSCFKAAKHWDESIFVVPEYAFGVDCRDWAIKISSEHSEFVWGTYAKIAALYSWDSNKTALWELNERIKNGALPDSLD